MADITTDWTSLELCTVDDVNDECKNIEFPLRYTVEGTDVEDGEITLAIRRAKAYARRKLLGKIKQIFEHSPGIGFGWREYCDRDPDAMDTALDRLANPEELKLWFVLCVIEQMFYLGNSVNAMEYNMQERKDALAEILRRKNEAFEDSWGLLKLDFDNSGVIDYTERAARTRTFTRT